MSNLRASLLARRPGAALPGPELDVTPVMNMFIILIPFLVGMSAFTHLSAHELTVPGDQSLAADTEVPPLPLVVAVGSPGCRLSLGDRVLLELPRSGDGALPLAALTAGLTGLELNKVIIAADEDVTADEVVRCLDAVRGLGCADLGLAAGTGLQLSGEVHP